MDVEARKHLIKELTDSSSEERPFYQDPARDLNLKIVTLDIDVPIYRMENARTRPAQIRYLYENKITNKDYFKNGQEDVDIQRIQHKLLLEFAKEEVGSESGTDIWTVLQQDGKQTDEILITHEGVVVNGNRRLAAMRELSMGDEGNPKFKKVRALVLPPDVGGKDIKKIEVRLQVTPQTILPYTWTAEALLIKDLQADNIDAAEIRKLMRKEKQQDIDDIVGRLIEADTYLTECLKQPEHYAEADKQEQQFIELQKALKTKKPSEQDAARKVFSSITKYADDSERRVYDYRTAFGKNMTKVLDRFAAVEGIALQAPPPAPKEDIFGGGAPVDPIARYKPVLDRIGKYEKDDAKKLREATEFVLESERNENDSRQPLVKLQAAENALNAVRPENAPADVKNEMRSVFSRIQKLVESIAARLEKQ